MKIAIISAKSKNRAGGVEDHTAILFDRIKIKFDVVLYDSPPYNSDSAINIATELKQNNVRAAIIQYTPNLYGWRNFYIIYLLKELNKVGINSILFLHEFFTPEYSGIIRSIIQKYIQHYKDKRAISLASRVAVSTEHRVLAAAKYSKREPIRIPIFSNIPECKNFAIDVKYLFAAFGVGHHDTNVDGIVKAISYFNGERALLIGGLNSKNFNSQQIDTTGYLSPIAASDSICSAKYFILYDKRGLSFRKGSAAAAFCNRRVVIANRSSWTDSEFIHNENVVFFDGTVDGLVATICELNSNALLRERVSKGGYELYQKYLTPESTVNQLVKIVGEQI